MALIAVLAEECGDVAAVSSDSKNNVVFVTIAILLPLSWLHKIIPVLLGGRQHLPVKLLGLIPSRGNYKKI